MSKTQIISELDEAGWLAMDAVRRMWKESKERSNRNWELKHLVL